MRSEKIVASRLSPVPRPFYSATIENTLRASECRSVGVSECSTNSTGLKQFPCKYSSSFVREQWPHLQGKVCLTFKMERDDETGHFATVNFIEKTELLNAWKRQSFVNLIKILFCGLLY